MEIINFPEEYDSMVNDDSEIDEISLIDKDEISFHNEQCLSGANLNWNQE